MVRSLFFIILLVQSVPMLELPNSVRKRIFGVSKIACGDSRVSEKGNN